MTKSTYQEECSQPKNDGFPKLMKHIRTGSISLFLHEKHGTTLVALGSSPMGGANTPEVGLMLENWEPFYGSVTVTSTKD